MPPAPLILFTNNDQLYLRLMDVILAEAGYTNVVTVTNKDAYLIARAQQPTLMLIDISFGVEPEGWATLDRLTLDPATTRIPIIVCSTDTSLLRAKAEWFALHHISVLEKPFNVPDVLTTIARVLAAHSGEA